MQKAGLKLNMQKAKIIASGFIASWQIDGKTFQTVIDFIFLCSKSLWTVTAAMKLRHLSLERKAMTNIDSILNSRDCFANKGPSSQSYGLFPVVMYGCESWTTKKA